MTSSSNSWTFPNLSIETGIQDCTQKLDDPFYDYYNQLQNAFKKILVVLQMLIPPRQLWICIINRLNWDLFLPSSKKDEDGMENYVYFRLN